MWRRLRVRVRVRVDLLRAVLPGHTTLTLTLTRLPKCGPATRWWAYPYPYPYPNQVPEVVRGARA